MNPNRRSIIVALAAAGATLATAIPHTALAQAWPAKSIRIIVPFAPGGTSDAVARLFAEKMQPILGQSVVIENRPGGGGSIGAAQVAKADPDGYTLLVMPGTHVLADYLLKTPPFHPFNDFTPVSMLVFAPYVIYAAKNQPFSNVPDMIKFARANPEKLAVGNSDITTRLAAEAFAIEAKIKLTHINYKGGGPITTDVVGGHLPMGVGTPITIQAFYKEGRVTPLVATTPKRLAVMPEIPTVAEALNIPGFEAGTWFALAGPANLPRPIVDRIQKAVAQAMPDAEVRSKLLGMGVVPAEDTTPEGMSAVMKSFADRNIALIKTVGIKPE
jgi:tripartite-type tricarboxylate transporter receptor subunit TctC